MFPINNASQFLSKLTLTPERSVLDALNALNLKDGQRMEATVVKPLSSQDVLLEIQGRQVQVKTRIPLKKGANLTLKYLSNDDGPALKLIDMQLPGQKTVNLAAIRAAIDDNIWKRITREAVAGEDGSPCRENIRHLLKKNSDLMLSQPGGKGLKALIDASGLTWENKLSQMAADKTSGREVVNALMDGDVKGLISKALGNNETLGSALKSLATVLDNVQLLNLHGIQQAGKLFLPLPLHFGDGVVGLAQVLFDLPEKGGGEAAEKEKGKATSPYTVVMLLDLTALGAIRSELMLSGSHIQGRFLVDRPETLHRLERGLPSFVEILESRGFTTGHMGCQQVDTVRVKKSLIDEILPQEGSSVCFVA